MTTSTKKHPRPVDAAVGVRVRMRRLQLRITQQELGDKIGLTFQQVQKYEKGTNRIGASRLHQIAEVLQCPVAFFFEGNANIVATELGAPDPVAMLTTSDGMTIARCWHKLRPNVRKAIAHLCEQAVSNG